MPYLFVNFEFHSDKIFLYTEHSDSHCYLNSELPVPNPRCNLYGFFSHTSNILKKNDCLCSVSLDSRNCTVMISAIYNSLFVAFEDYVTTESMYRTV